MIAEFKTTPLRLQIERDSIRQVIVNNKYITSTYLARHESTATEGKVAVNFIFHALYIFRLLAVC